MSWQLIESKKRIGKPPDVHTVGSGVLPVKPLMQSNKKGACSATGAIVSPVLCLALNKLPNETTTKISATEGRYPAQGGRAGRAVEDEKPRARRRNNRVQQRAAHGGRRGRSGASRWKEAGRAVPRFPMRMLWCWRKVREGGLRCGTYFDGCAGRAHRKRNGRVVSLGCWCGALIP